MNKKKSKIILNPKKIDEGDEIDREKKGNQGKATNNPFEEKSSQKDEPVNNPFDDTTTSSDTVDQNSYKEEPNNPFAKEPESESRNDEDATEYSDLDRKNYEHKDPPETPDNDLEIDSNIPYFFVFGNDNAGKSAMLSGLLYYIKTSGIGQLRSLSLNDMEHHRKGDYVLSQMTKKVRNGEFITGTQALDITEFVFPTEINLEFEPNNRPNMPFCLLEMAGEDLKEIELKNEGKSGGKFDERINAYLQHPKCNLIFLCVVDVDTPHDSEDLIDQFFNYIHKIGHINNPVLVSINKWDKVSSKYENVKDYIERELPILKNHLLDTNREMAYMKFSIGNVVSNGVDDDTYNYKPEDSEKLLKWMYQTATGMSLDQEIKKSLGKNFFNSFKNMFSNE